jgi:Protein of unknown function (DUF760)
MNNSTTQSLGSFDSPFSMDNPLAKYIQSLPEDAIARMHQPAPDAAKFMQSNLLGMLGVLPGGGFDVQVSTSRENLGQLMASAMAYGYFLHVAEQRMALANTFSQTLKEAE